ncbi:hypothetical protein K2P97_00010 [bacterium]|nr:hypothetical protein [bacterium]
MNSVFFNVYNYKIKIISTDFKPENFKIIQDFEFFQSAESTQNNLEIKVLSFSSFQKKGIFIGRTRMCEVRQISLSKRQLIYIYNDETLAVVEDNSHRSRKVTLWAKNTEVVDDILYFLINSCVGEFLDLNGKMRIHALSCRSSLKSSIVYGRPGSGKSTLAYSLLKSEHFSIFSDEITLLNLQDQKLIPYPVRLGITHETQSHKTTDKKFIYFFKTKFLIKIPSEKIAKTSQVNNFYYLNEGPLSSVNLAAQLLMGTGLIQMWEYLLRPNNCLTILKIFINRVKLVSILSRLPRSHLSRDLNIEASLNHLK